MTERTPENVIWHALRDADSEPGPSPYSGTVDRIMRELTMAGFSIEDTLHEADPNQRLYVSPDNRIA